LAGGFVKEVPVFQVTDAVQGFDSECVTALWQGYEKVFDACGVRRDVRKCAMDEEVDDFLASMCRSARGTNLVAASFSTN
jgi:hypothetical protein